MITLDNMENNDASKKNNDRARPDRVVEPQEQTPGEILEGQGTAAHEAERPRNPVRSGIGGRVDERECEEIDRRGEQALKILSTMLGGPYA
tara:strand:- start:94 stop:366 length:273 start_codon:yes stop_codon:yes gene_type:complete